MVSTAFHLSLQAKAHAGLPYRHPGESRGPENLAEPGFLLAQK
jgi:hypothetical protein